MHAAGPLKGILLATDDPLGLAADAIERGVEEGSPTCDLLRNWLQTKPDARLLEVWKGYIDELKESLGERSKTHLKIGTMGRARAIAEAAGGFLGVASISTAEKKMLEELERAFD